MLSNHALLDRKTCQILHGLVTGRRFRIRAYTYTRPPLCLCVIVSRIMYFITSSFSRLADRAAAFVVSIIAHLWYFVNRQFAQNFGTFVVFCVLCRDQFLVGASAVGVVLYAIHRADFVKRGLRAGFAPFPLFGMPVPCGLLTVPAHT